MNIDNGTYIKAEIKSIQPTRTFTNKETGEQYKYYDLIIDEGGSIQKKKIRLSKEQISLGMIDSISKNYTSKVSLIPVWVSSYTTKNGSSIIQYNYSGSDLPLLATAAGASNG